LIEAFGEAGPCACASAFFKIASNENVEDWQTISTNVALQGSVQSEVSMLGGEDQLAVCSRRIVIYSYLEAVTVWVTKYTSLI